MQRFLFSAAAMLLVVSLPAALVAQETGALTVLVVAGNGAVNDTFHYVPTPTIIEVRDPLDQPVSGATVSFTFPESGPSGRFADGSRTWTSTTDTRGRLLLSGFVPNRLEGSYQISVNASSNGRSGSVLIRETNGVFVSPTARPRGHMGSGSKVLIVLGIGAAVAMGSLLSIKGGGSGGTSTAASSTSISIGTISIGAPRQ